MDSNGWVPNGGIAVALVGFAVTRLVVPGAVGTTAGPGFLLAGLLPMVLGLGVTVYGVVLAVGYYPRAYANDVARWCLLGTAGMLAVLVVTAGESMLGGEGVRPLVASPVLVANVLLGGAVAGSLVGSRSATNRRQRRELRRRANQARLVNRLLRHELINAATVVDGHATRLTDGGDPAAVDAIRGAATRIVDTVDEIGDVIAERPIERRSDLAAVLEEAVTALGEARPDCRVDYAGPDEGVVVEGVRCPAIAFRELLEDAIKTRNAAAVAVELRADDRRVTVDVTDDGRPLDPDAESLLAEGTFPEHDDPTSGFGLQVVRLLVARSGGTIDVATGEGETTVTVGLPRANGGAGPPGVPSHLALGRAVAGGLLAGVAMGGYLSATSDTMAVIGVLYGVENAVVGWVTHLFHSVVFAVLFVAATTSEPLRRPVTGPARTVAAGVGWGGLLWLVAAGVVMPAWLQVVGVAAPLPNLSRLGLVSHLLWGGSLGVAAVALRALPVPETPWTAKK